MPLPRLAARGCVLVAHWHLTRASELSRIEIREERWDPKERSGVVEWKKNGSGGFDVEKR